MNTGLAVQTTLRHIEDLPPLTPDLAADVLTQIFITRQQPTTEVASSAASTRARRDDLLFANPNNLPPSFSGRTFDLISAALHYAHDEEWASRPRLYAICRQSGLLNMKITLIERKIYDIALPFSKEIPPPILRGHELENFLECQYHTLEYEARIPRSIEGQHCHFLEDEPLSIRHLRAIYGSADGPVVVDHVFNLTSGRQYARKAIRRNRSPREDVRIMMHYNQELAVLKRLSHLHLVQLAGSYTSPNYYGLIMSPVAGSNLYQFLQQHPLSPEEKAWTREWFGCLVNGLEHLHGQNIRHKDIKPQNILVHNKRVLITDFGLAFDWTSAERATTTGIPTGFTPRYMAPEVADYEARNTSSDVYSLGCVFLDMATVLNDRTLEQMDRFFESHGSREKFIRRNQEALRLWLQQLREAEYIAPLAWIEQMTFIDQTIRPSCGTLLQAIYQAEEYCGQCCSPGRGTSAIAVDHLGAVSDPSVLEASITSFLNSFTVDANTAWFMIADSGEVELLRHLFEPSRGKFDINAHNSDGVTALYLLASRGHRDAAHYIIDQGAAVEETLKKAVTDGQATAVEILLPFYPDVNLFDDRGITLLHEAAFLDHREVARLLLDSGADIDARSRAHRYEHLSGSHQGEDGRTPLMAATASGATSTLALLIDGGADSNAQDAMGNTALMHASLYGWSNVVSLLLEHHADAELSNDSKRKALHMASWNGHHEIVRQLLEHNADPNVSDTANLTPLHLAAQRRREAVVVLLLQYGADTRLRDSLYRTALDHARNFPNITRLLRDTLTF